jgi:cytoskeletal protein RodZ
MLNLNALTFMEKRLRSQNNPGFSLGFALGAAFGVAAGLLWTNLTNQKDTWEPLLESDSSVQETGEIAEATTLQPPKRHVKRSTASTGSSDASAGRTVSNIDDLPDRG